LKKESTLTMQDSTLQGAAPGAAQFDAQRAAQRAELIVKGSKESGVPIQEFWEAMEKMGLKPELRTERANIINAARLRKTPDKKRYIHKSFIPEGGFPKMEKPSRRRSTKPVEPQGAAVPAAPTLPFADESDDVTDVATQPESPQPAQPSAPPTPEPTLGQALQEFTIPEFPQDLLTSIMDLVSLIEADPDEEYDEGQEQVELRLNGGIVEFQDANNRKKGTFSGVDRIVVYFLPEPEEGSAE
jgi:hypothetical protein